MRSCKLLIIFSALKLIYILFMSTSVLRILEWNSSVYIIAAIRYSLVLAMNLVVLTYDIRNLKFFRQFNTAPDKLEFRSQNLARMLEVIDCSRFMKFKYLKYYFRDIPFEMKGKIRRVFFYYNRMVEKVALKYCGMFIMVFLVVFINMLL